MSLNLGQLLARLVVNSRSGLREEKKEKAIASCVGVQSRVNAGSNIYSILIGDNTELNKLVFEKISELKSPDLDLSNTQVSDLGPIANWTGTHILIDSND